MKLVTRRDWVRNLGGSVLGVPLSISRGEAEVTPEVLRFQPEIEPLVALMERTPREKCAEMVVEQMRRGVSYRQLLAALFLAGVRNINPRPPGFALHCVFVIHSAHIIGLESPSSSRLLPLFYALDNFKSAQERDARAGDYVMCSIQRALPAPERAAAELAAAMESWDQERGERAIVSLARHRGAAEILDSLWEYGARDYRNIGHKAIYAANAARTLNAIGWQYAEPVLRSLVLSLLDFGPDRHVNGYAFEDQCYSGNRKLVKETYSRLAAGWSGGNEDLEATGAVLESIRKSAPGEACQETSARLVKGAATAASVWDAVHLGAAELTMRCHPGAIIVGLHAVTSANALHHAWLAAASSQLRYLLLLQAVGWMTQFRAWAEQRQSGLRALKITELEGQNEAKSLDEALGAILSDIPEAADAAARRAFSLAREPAAREMFFTAAAGSVVGRADEVHYYKYQAALIEDVPLVSPRWRPHLSAAAVYYLKGKQAPESLPIQRAREALKKLAV